MESRDIDNPLDVVIVGAGLAGLACACELKDKQVLLLEKNSRAGGRVLSRDVQGYPVDLGACFAMDTELLPKEFTHNLGELIQERGPIGIHEGGHTVFSDTPYNCLANMELDQRTRAQIADFANGRLHGDALMGTRAYRLLNALFHQVHPGELVQYAPDYQRHGLLDWFPDHWQGGNGAVVDNFVSQCFVNPCFVNPCFVSQCPAQLLLNVEATSIEESAQSIQVRYRQDGEERCAAARAVVLATPLTDAARLTQPFMGSHTLELLSAIHYGNFTVVAIAGTALHKLPEFRYIVIADRTLSMLVQQRSLDRKHSVLLCYYADSACQSVANMADDDLLAFTQTELTAVGLDPEVLEQAQEAFVQRWVPGGTIISTDFLQARNRLPNPLGKRVFLAGDYLSSLGYGTISAVASGMDTAKLVRDLLG